MLLIIPRWPSNPLPSENNKAAKTGGFFVTREIFSTRGVCPSRKNQRSRMFARLFFMGERTHMLYMWPSQALFDFDFSAILIFFAITAHNVAVTC